MAEPPVVWVVEDDSMVAQFVGDLLQANGYKVVWFPGGGDVIQALESSDIKRPALILLDIKMPPPDGNDVLLYIRDKTVLVGDGIRIGAPPVVVLSGYPEMISPPVRDVPRAILTKPPGFSALLETVSRIAGPTGVKPATSD